MDGLKRQDLYVTLDQSLCTGILTYEMVGETGGLERGDWYWRDSGGGGA